MATLGEAGEAMLGKATHDEASKTASIKIYAKIGM